MNCPHWTFAEGVFIGTVFPAPLLMLALAAAAGLFTAEGRAKRRRDRRHSALAVRYMDMGYDDREARIMASREMEAEAAETLRQVAELERAR